MSIKVYLNAYNFAPDKVTALDIYEFQSYMGSPQHYADFVR